MIALTKLLETVDYQAKGDVQSRAINKIQYDSRKCQPNDLFVAIAGHTRDGHQFIPSVASKKPAVIICQEWPQSLHPNITYIKVACTKEALGIIAHNYYDKPSDHLKLIGITGTNGKTTVSTLLYRLFESSGQKSGLISTVDIRNHHRVYNTTLTTPDSLQINYHLHQMVQSGIKHCFMEVSSHGIDQKRIKGLNFSGGIFTNLSRDHLDYHDTYKSYRDVKKSFFDSLKPDAFALFNQDDRNGKFMVQNTKAKKYSYALHSDANFKGKIIERSLDGTLLKVEGVEFWTNLVGDFNAYNLLATYGTASILGHENESLPQDLSKLQGVPGRFELFKSPKGTTVIIDFAHTPDALLNVLTSIERLKTAGQKIITVIGCGGDRDKSKRPLIGKIATQYSNRVVFTSDNPRNESAQLIIQQMVDGIENLHNKSKVICESDRQSAIKCAYQLASNQDIVLIAGKGHEKFQEIKGQKHIFDDLAIAKKLFI